MTSTSNAQHSILHELDSAFGDVSYPGDTALAASRPSEWDSTLRRLCGKRWREVTAEDFDSQDGLVGSVQALSLKGLVYFLPGLVRIALTDSTARYAVVDALVSRFTCPDHLPESCGFEKEVIAALSATRRDFLARFLAEMEKVEPHFCPVLIESAIANLRNGDVKSYRHEDVQKWAAKSG